MQVSKTVAIMSLPMCILLTIAYAQGQGVGYAEPGPGGMPAIDLMGGSGGNQVPGGSGGGTPVGNQGGAGGSFSLDNIAVQGYIGNDGSFAAMPLFSGPRCVYLCLLIQYPDLNGNPITIASPEVYSCPGANTNLKPIVPLPPWVTKAKYQIVYSEQPNSNLMLFSGINAGIFEVERYPSYIPYIPGGYPTQ